MKKTNRNNSMKKLREKIIQWEDDMKQMYLKAETNYEIGNGDDGKQEYYQLGVAKGIRVARNCLRRAIGETYNVW